MFNSTSRFLFVIGCLATLMMHKSASDALLLGNFIGCNSFGCRISALESDVAQLKQQVARLDPSGHLQGMNNMRPNNMQPFNQNMNPQQQQMNGQQQNNNGNAQPNQRQGEDGGRVSYSLDYPVVNNQNLRRNPNYPNGLNSGQFMNL